MLASICVYGNADVCSMFLFRPYSIYELTTNLDLTASRSAPGSGRSASVLSIPHIDLCNLGPVILALACETTSRVTLCCVRGSSVVHPTYATTLVPANTDESCLIATINDFPHVLGLYHCSKWICNHHSRSKPGLTILSQRSSPSTGTCSGYRVWTPRDSCS